MASTPVPSAWPEESVTHTPTPRIPHLMACNSDSAPPASPTSQGFPSMADTVFRSSDARTSITLDKEGGKEKWIPTAGFTRPFEYVEWEEWVGGESGMHTTEGSLCGYSGGDEENRITVWNF